MRIDNLNVAYREAAPGNEIVHHLDHDFALNLERRTGVVNENVQRFGYRTVEGVLDGEDARAMSIGPMT